MQSRNRILFTAPLLGAVAACGSPGLPAKATVVTIDHECVIIESTGRSVDDPRGGGQINASEMRTTKGECKSVDEWAEVRKKRNKKVDGTAAVHVEYRAPQDGSFRTGTLNFTGRDDEFYELKAGDTIDIVVAKDNPDRIRKS
ncbi:MAG: hypothetical protein ACJ8EY_09745 [Sphingomicrobium sp.]